MQRIWSRSAPAGPASRCVSCLTTAAEGVTSRSASAASKRRLRIGNSVTALYTSIFAAAALADARAKGNRRLEWEEKIAAVKEEVNELLNEEQRLLEALASGRTKDHLRRALQARPFHTLPRPTPSNVQFPRINPPCRSSHSMSNAAKLNTAERDALKFEESLEESIIRELESENLAPVKDVDDFDMAIDGEGISVQLSGRRFIRAKAIRKLALRQLAIRLLLRPAIAHSYQGVLKNYDANNAYPQLQVADLLFELDKIRRRLRVIKTVYEAPIDDLVGDLRQPLKDHVYERVQLDKRVRQDTQLYLNNEMPLEELLLRLSDHLLRARDPDRTYVLKMMILAFTKTRQNDLAEMVVKTILPYKFPLSSSLIVSIINFFRKSKDLKAFDLFLQMLQGKGYPVDMGNLGYFKKKVINGVEVTIPPVHSANIVVYAALIKACLRFDQPDRADAYLLAARAAGCMDDFAILMAYMEFYTIRRDWENGRQVLNRALAFIAGTTEHPLARVGRLITMMVNLCDSCRKLEVSEALIRAAVKSGFDWQIAQKQSDVISEVDPDFQRWQTAAEVSTVANKEISVGDMFYMFVNSAKEHLDTLSLPEESSARRLQKHMRTYSTQVLSSVMSVHPAQKQTTEDGQPPEAHNDTQCQTAKLEQNDPSAPSEQLVTAQQQEISALRNEVAQLKQMVFQMFHSTAGPTPPQSPTNGPSNLKKGFVPQTPALTENPPPQNKQTLNLDDAHCLGGT